MPDWIDRGPKGASLPVLSETSVVGGGIATSVLEVKMEPIVSVNSENGGRLEFGY
jgi:hypothetical protein